MKHDGHFVADRAVRLHLVVVSTPSLAFSPCRVEAQEPVGIQALGPELALQALDEGFVGWLAWPAEVQREVVHESPQVELLADELGPVVETDGLGIAELPRDALEGFEDIDTAEALPHIVCWRESGERVDDGRIRILVPSNSWSWTKSIAQMWFAAVAGERPSRNLALPRRLGDLLRNCRSCSR